MQADRVSVECVDQLAHRNSAASGESCTDISRPERPQSQRVLLGPLVFKVTSSSAVAMIELALSGPVELLCVDQLTGEEV